MSATHSNKVSPYEQSPRRIATALNNVIDGRTDNYGTCTLTASTVQTVVTLANTQVSENSTVILTARTANAAAALATTYVSDTSNGSFTLTHASNAQTDRIFSYAWIG